MTYAIRVKLTQYKINKVTQRLLKKRYKSLRAAEKMAKNYRWVCKPEGVPTEECDASVITI